MMVNFKIFKSEIIPIKKIKKINNNKPILASQKKINNNKKTVPPDSTILLFILTKFL